METTIEGLGYQTHALKTRPFLTVPELGIKLTWECFRHDPPSKVRSAEIDIRCPVRP